VNLKGFKGRPHFVGYSGRILRVFDYLIDYELVLLFGKAGEVNRFGKLFIIFGLTLVLPTAFGFRGWLLEVSFNFLGWT
jgi:hypothetical protein